MDVEEAVADASPNEGSAVLARNLRRARQLRGIGLSALARDSGVARATLYQMEAGGGNPTMDTLWAVSNTLKVPLSELVADSASPDVQVIRADASADMVGRSAAMRLIRRFNSANGLLELYHMRIEPGEELEGHPHPAGVYEHVLVTQGILATGPEGQVAELGPGDYISFRADVPHHYQAFADDVVIATLVMDYPPTMAIPHGRDVD